MLKPMNFYTNSGTASNFLTHVQQHMTNQEPGGSHTLIDN